MNVVRKHPATPPGRSLVVPDPTEPVDLVGARIPHVSIHAFPETEAFATTWRQTERDRRLHAATTALRPGGLPGAINLYGAERSPDLIIVESDAAENELCFRLDSLADVCRPETRVIVVGSRNDIQLYRRLLDMGVSSYLVSPVEIATVIATIADIYCEQGRDKVGRIAAVLGAKGGVGASAVAESIALELSNRRGSDVLLIDLDIAFGTAGLDLDLEPNQGLAELIRDPERIDAEMLDRLCVRRGANLTLLGAASGLDTGREIDEPAIERVIEVAQSHVRQIVLDVPHLWTPWVERALVAADDVIVVSTPELASLRNAAAIIGRVCGLRPNDPKPHLVLNQVGVPRRQEITARDIAQVLEIEPALSIPFDARSFSLAAARGCMVAEVARRRPLAQAYGRLAGLIDRDAPAVQGRRRPRWFLGRRGGERRP